MLLELAIGDAYGAGFEYAEPEFVETHNHLRGYVQNLRHPLIPGSYTDDTQMSLAIAEVLISGQPWTEPVLADAFVRVFKRDQREGYAGKFYQYLCSVENGEQFLAGINWHSDKSGAAMRATPIGLLPDIEQVMDYARIQARITHNTPDGIRAAIASALMAHYFCYQLGAKADLGQFLEAHVSGYWATPWTGKVKSQGWMSVQAAVTAIMCNHSLSGLLHDCIAFTGDVDTVAAMALSAASWSPEIEPDLPDVLISGLESGAYGIDYLRRLDRQLLCFKP